MHYSSLLQCRQPLLLFGILLVATVLRIYGIGQPFSDMTSWRQTDMATMVDNYYHGNWNIFLPQISWNGPGANYVGYEFQLTTYLTALLYHIFGPHDWVGRGVVVAFSLWGIFAFYQLVAKVWTRKLALLSTAILALIPGSVYFDRAFMPDSVMLSLVITSFWMLACYLQSFRLGYLVLASFFGMLGFLTKISGIFLSIPMLYATVSILQKKENFSVKRVVQLSIAAIVTLIPVVAYYAWALYVSKHYPPYYAAAGGYWVWKFGLTHFLEEGYFLRKLYHRLTWMWTKPVILSVILSLVISIADIILQNAFRKKKERDVRLPWLFHWWLFGIGVYYLIAAIGIVNNPGNLTLLSPAVAALIATLLLRVSRWVEEAFRFSISVFLIAIFLGLVATIGLRDRKVIFSNYDRDDYRMGLALREVSKPEDFVITATRVPGTSIAVYYSQRKGWTFPPVGRWEHYKDNDKEALAAMSELVEKGAEWLGVSKAQ